MVVPCVQVRAHQAQLLAQPWQYVVLDEGHTIRNQYIVLIKYEVGYLIRVNPRILFCRYEPTRRNCSRSPGSTWFLTRDTRSETRSPISPASASSLTHR